MKISCEFSALWNLARELGAKRFDLPIVIGHSVGSIDAKLANEGIEIDLDDIQIVHSLLSYKGRQVVLYIPDQGTKIESVMLGDKESGKRFHIANCDTLEQMKRDGRFDRYIATKKIDGKFCVHGVDKEGKEKRAEEVGLYVCKNCLRFLNYKQAVLSNINKIRDSFSIQEFFETYSSIFPELPARRYVSQVSGYVSDWEEISKKMRERAKWRCSKCRVDLSEHRNLLHVHHIDGIKNNNMAKNLKVLCVACHRDEPRHTNLNLNIDQMKTINKLRRKAGLIKNDWKSVIKMSDPALRGILGLAQDAGYTIPEIEFPLTEDFSLEIAWLDKNLGISLKTASPQIDGWKILNLTEASGYFSSNNKPKYIPRKKKAY